MLDEVNKPGSDIEEYLGHVERILEEKNSSIAEMRQSIANFKKNIELERVLNRKVNALQKKAVGASDRMNEGYRPDLGY